jgi:hypothetical protein
MTTRIPREAREGLLRAWLAILRDRHPEVTWIAADTAETAVSSASREEQPKAQASAPVLQEAA